MIKVEKKHHVNNSAKKIFKNNKALFNEFLQALLLFESNPKAPKLKLHALKGNLKGLHSFSVNKDVRVVLVFTDEETVTFLAIGKHDDIY